MAYVELVNEGKRQMQICNACRYCEGYCAVWHAIEHRREFTEGDMTYLSNLCHDCRECVFACPFTTPHEFGVNPPKLFAGLREETYKKYAFASPLRKLNFWTVTAIAMVLLVLIASATNGFSSIFYQHIGVGAFYKVLSAAVLTLIFILLGMWMVAAWVAGAARYWKDIKSSGSDKVIFKDVKDALVYSASLKYLDKGSTEEKLPMNRKWLHHFVAYGFLLDIVSTTLGAFYSHVLHIDAPYPVTNPVVIFGVLGGMGIIIGASGLLFVKSKMNKDVNDEKAAKSGRAFTISLLFVAVTGMILLLARDTAAMGMMLVVHLSTVASLFFTAPYTKFTHFVYRFMALVRYAQEERMHQHH